MKIYVTFGQSHIHRVNNKILDKDCVAVIDSPNESEGRAISFELFGDKFFTTYTESNFNMENMKYFPRGFIYLYDEYECPCLYIEEVNNDGVIELICTNCGNTVV